MTSPWARFQEPPSIHIDYPANDGIWPEWEASENYDPNKPWRVRRHNPYANRRGLDDDIVAQFEQHNVPQGFIWAAATLNQLARFADVRQTRFKGPPNRHGTNVHVVLKSPLENGGLFETNGSADLSTMWRCYANILRAIHREGQIRGGANGSWIYQPYEELVEMMHTYPAQLERIELDRLGGDSINNNLTPGFEWLHALAAHVNEMTTSLHAILTWAREAHVDPKDHIPQATSSLPPMVQLIMTLKSREIIFENALGDEHFQDVLMDKRVWMIAPKDFYDSGLDRKRPAKKWVNHLNGNVKCKLRQLRRELQDRFDYRLLVDWGYGRLWKKLYILFHPQNEGEKDAIREFSNFATGHSKLAFDLFAIHPLDLEEMKADPCSVCLCDFEHDELIMETHCNHHFHPACLYNYWDDPNRFQNRCPECRTSQGILREKVDFEAEREDRCYEARHELEGLEQAHVEAMQERVAAGVSLGDSRALMEIWCRWFMAPLLKEQRRLQKKHTPGWDDLK